MHPWRRSDRFEQQKNILISQDGRALVADYGVATLVDSVFDNIVAVSSFCGSYLRWVAPETMESYGELTTKNDIWAFGMLVLVCPQLLLVDFPRLSLLQELLTTQPPFHEIPGLRAVISRIMQGPPDRPSDEDTCGRLTNTWWNVCHSCWHHSPSHRPPISDILTGLK